MKVCNKFSKGQTKQYGRENKCTYKIYIYKNLKRKRDMFLKLIPNDLFCLIRFIYYIHDLFYYTYISFYCALGLACYCTIL